MSRLLRNFARDKYGTAVECRQVLTFHIDGKRVPFPPQHSRRRMIMRLLIDRRFLEDHVTYTVITALGRQALAEFLADYADALFTAALASQEKQLWQKYQCARLAEQSSVWQSAHAITHADGEAGKGEAERDTVAAVAGGSDGTLADREDQALSAQR